MTDDDLADALASDFTCTTIPSAGEKEVRPKEVLGYCLLKEYCQA